MVGGKFDKSKSVSKVSTKPQPAFYTGRTNTHYTIAESTGHR
jgi:hypothetical protein